MQKKKSNLEKFSSFVKNASLAKYEEKKQQFDL